MKIGTLSLSIAENYDGILQAIASYRLLHKQSHETVLIYKTSNPVFWKKTIRFILEKIPFHNFKGIKISIKSHKPLAIDCSPSMEEDKKLYDGRDLTAIYDLVLKKFNIEK
jgi:hypothetical protein